MKKIMLGLLLAASAAFATVTVPYIHQPNTQIKASEVNANNAAMTTEINDHTSATNGVHGVTGNVVGTTDTQTLQNKSLVDETTYIIGSETPTKYAQFEVDGLDSFADITIPNDSSFVMVGDDTPQTLKNKILDGTNSVAIGSLPSTVVYTDTAQVITGEKSLSDVIISRIKTLSGTTQGHIVPDVADDTFMLIEASQSIGNKIIDGNENTLQNIPDTALQIIRTNDKVAWNAVDKNTSNLSDIQTKSHLVLSDIGSNAHSDIDVHIGRTNNAHGIVGDFVGTTDTQTLTNKTISGSFTGPVTGDVTGNLTGNVTGNVTGDLTGNVTGTFIGNINGDTTGDHTGSVHLQGQDNKPRLLEVKEDMSVGGVNLSSYITGTTNQITVDTISSNGGVILRLPQDIATTSSASFDSVSANTITGTNGKFNSLSEGIVIPNVDSTGAIQVKSRNYSKTPLTIDTINSRVGVGLVDPTNTLNVHNPLGMVAGVRISNTNTGSAATDGLSIYNSNKTGYVTNLEGTDLIVGSGIYDTMDVVGNKIGVMNTTPRYSVDVTGDVRVRDAGTIKVGGTGTEYSVSMAASTGSLTVSTGVGLGNYTNKDIPITFNKDTSGIVPTIKYTQSTGTIQYSNDGATFSSLGSGGVNTLSNLGSGEGVYSSIVGTDARLKSIKAGTNITVSSDTNEITINSTATGGGTGDTTGVHTGAVTLLGQDNNLPRLLQVREDRSVAAAVVSNFIQGGANITVSGIASNGGVLISAGSSGEVNTASNLGTGEGVYASKSGVDLRFKSIKAGTNTTVTSTGSEITVNAIVGAAGKSQFTGYAGENIAGATESAVVYAKKEKILNISSANKYLDIQEGSDPAVTITIPEANYFRFNMGNGTATVGLDKEIQDLMNASALTCDNYVVTYNKATNYFTINGNGTGFSILCKTGTHGLDNANDNACSTLGFGIGATDSTGSTQYVSNAVTGSSAIGIFKTDTDFTKSEKASGITDETATTGNTITVTTSGQITGFTGLDAGTHYYTGPTAGGVLPSVSAVSNSFDLGFATASNALFSSLSPWIVSTPFGWLSTPLTKDYGAEIQSGDIACNDFGKCVQIVIYDPAGTPYYRFRYTTNGGASWSYSLNTIALGATVSDNFGGNYDLKPRIGIDNNGFAVSGILINTGGSWRAYYTNSNDFGETWSAATVLANDDEYSIGSLFVRSNKAVILINNTSNNNSQVFISNSISNSGYTTFSSSLGLANDFTHDVPSHIFIQYFGSTNDPTIANDYKIVTMGRYGGGGGALMYHSHKGDGTVLTDGTIFSDNFSSSSAGIDQSGLKNRIVVFYYYTGAATIREAESNEDISTLSWNTHSTHDINSGGSAPDANNGYTDSVNIHNMWNSQNRVVVVGNTTYAIMATNANPGTLPAMTLFRTQNLSAGTWTSSNVGRGTAADQEGFLCYEKSSGNLVAGWKEVGALANNLTQGNLYARTAERSGTGVLTWRDIESIDAGKASTGKLSFVQGVCYTGGAVISFETSGGSYDVLRTQVLY